MASTDNARLFGRVGVFLAALAVAVLAFWVVSGAGLVTQYQVATTQTVEDEFGDVVETTVLEDGFRFGLLPDRGYDGAAPISGVLGALAAGFFILARRRRKDELPGEEGSHGP